MALSFDNMFDFSSIYIKGHHLLLGHINNGILGVFSAGVYENSSYLNVDNNLSLK